MSTEPTVSRPRSRSVYLLPNLLTTGALFSGFYAIVAAIDGNFDAALDIVRELGAAGGGVDVMARLLAHKLSERLGQQFIAENRPGAAGIIGSKAVISSPPDGATLLYTPSSLSLTVVINKTAPYDVSKDFTPVVNVAISPYALIVHPSVPAKTVKELVQYAKDRPGQLNFGSSGVATGTHLSITSTKASGNEGAGIYVLGDAAAIAGSG